MSSINPTNSGITLSGSGFGLSGTQPAAESSLDNNNNWFSLDDTNYQLNHSVISPNMDNNTNMSIDQLAASVLSHIVTG